MKKALLVGINEYSDADASLYGCINDVNLMHDLLLKHYSFDHISTLKDEQASFENITISLRQLVSDVLPNDTILFHYSGHGSQVPDYDNDEKDYLDECLCPYELDWNNMITDDILKDIFKDVHCHAVLILDSCHSGTMLRNLSETNSTRPRFLHPPLSILNRNGQRNWRVKRLNNITAHDTILITGCKERQTSADAYIPEIAKYHGALTYYLDQALLKSKYNVSYSSLVSQTRKLLRTQKFDQIPQLETVKANFNKNFLNSVGI
ncbi:MAG: caspase family protein [Candidatus Jettenia caeni]|nr:MAG: caspase family protein [Candidatus Jettenia caeni]